MRPRRAQRDARAGAEEQGALRMRMQQERDVRLPPFGQGCRRPAHLQAVVHAQAAMPVCGAHDRHGSHHALAIRADISAGRQIDKPEIHGERESERSQKERQRTDHRTDSRDHR